MPEYSELANWDGALSDPPDARTDRSPYYRYPPQSTGDVPQVPAARSQFTDARSSSSLQPRASPLPRKYAPSYLSRPTPKPVHAHPRLPSSQPTASSSSTAQSLVSRLPPPEPAPWEHDPRMLAAPIIDLTDPDPDTPNHAHAPSYLNTLSTHDASTSLPAPDLPWSPFRGPDGPARPSDNPAGPQNALARALADPPQRDPSQALSHAAHQPSSPVARPPLNSTPDDEAAAMLAASLSERVRLPLSRPAPRSAPISHPPHLPLLPDQISPPPFASPLTPLASLDTSPASTHAPVAVAAPLRRSRRRRRRPARQVLAYVAVPPFPSGTSAADYHPMPDAIPAHAHESFHAAPSKAGRRKRARTDLHDGDAHGSPKKIRTEDSRAAPCPQPKPKPRRSHAQSAQGHAASASTAPPPPPPCATPAEDATLVDIFDLDAPYAHPVAALMVATRHIRAAMPPERPTTALPRASSVAGSIERAQARPTGSGDAVPTTGSEHAPCPDAEEFIAPVPALAAAAAADTYTSAPHPPLSEALPPLDLSHHPTHAFDDAGDVTMADHWSLDAPYTGIGAIDPAEHAQPHTAGFDDAVPAAGTWHAPCPDAEEPVVPTATAHAYTSGSPLLLSDALPTLGLPLYPAHAFGGGAGDVAMDDLWPLNAQYAGINTIDPSLLGGAPAEPSHHSPAPAPPTPSALRSPGSPGSLRSSSEASDDVPLALYAQPRARARIKSAEPSERSEQPSPDPSELRLQYPSSSPARQDEESDSDSDKSEFEPGPAAQKRVRTTEGAKTDKGKGRETRIEGQSSKRGPRATAVTYAQDSSFCHHCRNTTHLAKMGCTNGMLSGEQCKKLFCCRCVQKRYPDVVFDASKWFASCPYCLDICNCSVCSLRRGEAYLRERDGGWKRWGRDRDGGGSISYVPAPAGHTSAAVGPTTDTAPSVVPAERLSIAAYPSGTYFGTVYGLTGEKVGAAFVGSDQEEVVLRIAESPAPAPPAPSSSKKATTTHVFVGKPRKAWGKVRVREVDEHGNVVKARRRTTKKTGTLYIGSAEPLRARWKWRSLMAPMPDPFSDSPLASPTSSELSLPGPDEDDGDGDGGAWPGEVVLGEDAGLGEVPGLGLDLGLVGLSVVVPEPVVPGVAQEASGMQGAAVGLATTFGGLMSDQVTFAIAAGLRALHAA